LTTKFGKPKTDVHPVQTDDRIRTLLRIRLKRKLLADDDYGMDLLPRVEPLDRHAGTSSTGPATKLSWHKVKSGMKRMTKLSQMDFEVAAWQLTWLCIAPRRVYRNVYYHKQTKNKWSRDDPAILLLQGCCLAAAGLLWSLFYARFPFFQILRTVVSMVLVDFLLVGVLIATALWWVCMRFGDRPKCPTQGPCESLLSARKPHPRNRSAGRVVSFARRASIRVDASLAGLTPSTCTSTPSSPSSCTSTWPSYCCTPS
jgi:hypothetical protein